MQNGSLYSSTDPSGDLVHNKTENDPTNNHPYGGENGNKEVPNSLPVHRRAPLPPFSFGKPCFPLSGHQIKDKTGGETPTSPFLQHQFYPFNFNNNSNNNYPVFYPPNLPMQQLTAEEYMQMCGAGGSLYYVPPPGMAPVFHGPGGQFMHQDASMFHLENSTTHFNENFHCPDNNQVKQSNDSLPERNVFRSSEHGSHTEPFRSSKMETRTDERGKRIVKIDTIIRDDLGGRQAPPKAQLQPQRTNEPFFKTIKAPASRTLFVRNISRALAPKEILRLFSQYGDVAHVETTRHVAKGVVFVTYYDMRGSKRALEMMQNMEIHGRQISVHYSLPKKFDGNRPICTRNDYQGTLSVMCGELEFERADIEEMRRLFEKYGPLRGFSFVERNLRGKFYIAYQDNRDCVQATEEMHGTRFRRARLSVKLEWDHEKCSLDGVQVASPAKRFVNPTSPAGRMADRRMASPARRPPIIYEQTEVLTAKRQKMQEEEEAAFFIDKKPDPRLVKTRPAPPSLEDLYRSKETGVAAPELTSPPPLLSQMNALMESLQEKRPRSAVDVSSVVGSLAMPPVKVDDSPQKLGGNSAQKSPIKTPTVESVQKLAHLLLQQNQSMNMYR